jgi:hypothetical protein
MHAKGGNSNCSSSCHNSIIINALTAPMPYVVQINQAVVQSKVTFTSLTNNILANRTIYISLASTKKSTAT